MGRKPPVDRPLEEKWQIVQEGIKSESLICMFSWLYGGLAGQQESF
jgi:hypothetical protein